LLGLADQQPDLLTAFDGSPHGPKPLEPDETGTPANLVPAWLADRFDPLVGREEWPALLERAPLDIRVNKLRADRSAVRDLLEAVPTPLSPIGLRLPEGFRVEDTDAWRSGQVEIQDEGSQLLALACEARPGMTVVDLCAGAGGKTLALAAEMGGQGRLIACDTDRGRLSRMPPRLERAGVTIVEARLLDPGAERQSLSDLRDAADLVLVDAPCSGSGTWRRNPETRWRLTPERLTRLVALQAHLIGLAAELVRPGGTLVYAVCSLLAEEGREQADAFGRSRSAWVSEPIDISGGRPAGSGHLLSPARDGTDGFFVARWRAPC
jgi:16S rRNA (cytosine967-C5)-methyltransferase